MNLRLRQFGAACVLALALARPAFAQQEEDTPLAKKMKAINTAFKAVGRQVEDPTKNASTLAQIAIIETNAKEAMAFEPEKKGKVPAGEQAKFMDGYKAGMKDFLVSVEKLKGAIKANKNTDAVAIVDAMKGQQREGHKEYRIKKAGAPPGTL